MANLLNDDIAAGVARVVRSPAPIREREQRERLAALRLLRSDDGSSCRRPRSRHSPAPGELRAEGCAPPFAWKFRSALLRNRTIPPCRNNSSRSEERRVGKEGREG